MKTANCRLRSATLLIEPLCAALRAASASATASISDSGHTPLKARRVLSPPTHFQSGKMKLPKSKPSGSSTDSQSLSRLGKPQTIVGSEFELWRLTWPEAQDPGEQAWHAERGKAQQSENDDDRQKHGELLESIALHVAAPFAGGRSGVVVPIGVGAALAARPLVAGSALGAVHAAEARGCFAGSVTCLDVGCAVLTKHARQRAGVKSIRGSKGNSGESEAGACAIHVVTARCADDVVIRCGSVVKRPFTAAARVIVHGTIALGGGTKRARFANNRALGAVLSLLTRLTTKGVRRVVARSTDHALAAAQEWLVRAGRAFKTPGPVGAAWSIGSF
eukprot:scaffold69313_cov66-Phaeocystis_antarctica.AAC.2